MLIQSAIYKFPAGYISANDVEQQGAKLGAFIRRVILTLHLAAPHVGGVEVAEADKILKETEAEALQKLHEGLPNFDKIKCPHCRKVIAEGNPEE